MMPVYHRILGYRVRTKKILPDGHRRWVVMHNRKVCETQTNNGFSINGTSRALVPTMFRTRDRADRIRAKLGSEWQTVRVKIAAPVSPCCRKEWHWRLFGSMVRFSVIDGRKTYEVICSKCRKRFVLDGGKGDSL